MAEVDDKLKDYEIRKEGEAEILLHKRNAVFYNPVQVCSSSIFRVSFPFLFPKMGRCSIFSSFFLRKWRRCSVDSLSALSLQSALLILLVAIYYSDLLTSS